MFIVISKYFSAFRTQYFLQRKQILVFLTERHKGPENVGGFLIFLQLKLSCGVINEDEALAFI